MLTRKRAWNDSELKMMRRAGFRHRLRFYFTVLFSVLLLPFFWSSIVYFLSPLIRLWIPDDPMFRREPTMTLPMSMLSGMIASERAKRNSWFIQSLINSKLEIIPAANQEN